MNVRLRPAPVRSAPFSALRACLAVSLVLLCLAVCPAGSSAAEWHLPLIEGPVHFSDGTGALSFDGVLSLRPSFGPGGRIEGRAEVRGARVVTPWGGAQVDGRADVVLDGDTVLINGIRLRTADVSIGQALLPDAPDVSDLIITLTGSGNYDTASGKLNLPEFRFSVEGVTAGGGSFFMDADEMRVRLRGGVPDASKALAGLHKLLPAKTTETPVSGGLRYSVDFSEKGGRRRVSMTIRPEGLTAGEFRGRPVRFPEAPLRLTAAMKKGAAGKEAAAGTLSADWLGQVNWSLSRDGVLQAEAPSLRLEALGDHAEAALGVPLADWGLAGAAGLRVETGPEGGRVDLVVEEGSFASPDGQWLGEACGLDGSVVWRRGGDDILADCRLDMTTGEVLAGTVYLPVSEYPLHVSGRIRSGAGGSLALEEGEVGLRGFGTVQLAGERILPAVAESGSGVSGVPGDAAVSGDAGSSAAGAGWRAWVTVPWIELGPLFETFAREPLAVERPWLADWRLEGRLESVLALEWRDGSADIRGSLAVEDARLDDGGDIPLVSGVRLNLPYAYRFGAPPEPGAEAPGRGSLSAVIRLPGEDMTGVMRMEKLPVTLSPNRFTVDGSLDVPVLGGVLRLSDILVENPLSGAFRAGARAKLEGVDFSLLQPSGIPMEGEAGGDLGNVVLTADSLSAGGALKGTFFGGRFEAGGFAVSRPFSPGRVAQADTRVRSLDLERLSQALGVGRITGRMDIDLLDLVTAYGQPAAFDLTAQSVREDDIPQKISLKAVNSISVMGTGSGLSGAGIAVFSSMFRQFSYRKIGLRCTLGNDVFTVRGLIREGEVEYIIKRPTLFGINVINGNPDNRISFSDMLDRLARVIAPRGTDGAP